jgi:hypothetical protein
MGNRVLAATALTNISNPAAVILLSLVVVAATVVVWAALMVRKLLIIVAAVFAPVAFAGSLADITSSWVRRWIETTVALVVSKLILVIIFAIGLGVLVDGAGEAPQTGAGHVTQTVTQTVTGALILVMAGFAPWLAIKLVHFAGDSFHTIHAHVGAVKAGASTVAAIPQRVSNTAAKLPSPSPQASGRPPQGQDAAVGGGAGGGGVRTYGTAGSRPSPTGKAAGLGSAAVPVAGAALGAGAAGKAAVGAATGNVDRASTGAVPTDTNAQGRDRPAPPRAPTRREE